MLTYTGQRNLFGTFVKSSDEATKLIGDTLIDIQIKRLLGKRNWPFLSRTRDISLTASTQFKPAPADFKKAKTAYVTIGSTKYPIKECPSRETWDRLNTSIYTSDIPEYFFVTEGRVGLWPIPASSGNLLTLSYLRRQRKLTRPDYTTGTILTATNGSTTIAGTATAWTTPMAGRFICITETDTENTGDELWYEIDTISSATGLATVQPYIGTSIVAGAAAYTIGQASIIPEEYQDIPVLGAVVQYYKTIKPETDLAKEFKDEYNDRFSEMSQDLGQQGTSPVLNDPEDDGMIDPNLMITY